MDSQKWTSPLHIYNFLDVFYLYSTSHGSLVARSRESALSVVPREPFVRAKKYFMEDLFVPLNYQQYRKMTQWQRRNLLETIWASPLCNKEHSSRSTWVQAL